MGRLEGVTFTVPGYLHGNGFDCKVAVTLQLFHVDHSAPLQRNPEASVLGMQRTEPSLRLDDNEDEGKEQYLVISSGLHERLRLDLDLPEDAGDLSFRTANCELVRPEGSSRQWKVRLTARLP